MKRIPKHIMVSLIILIISFVFLAISRASTGFSTWYAIHIYPFFQLTISRITGLFGFSFFELLIIIAVVTVISALFKYVVLLIKYHQRTNINNFTKPLKKSLGNLLCCVAYLLCIFTFTCGINYGREPFSDYSGLEIKERSADELIYLADYLIGNLNSYVEDLTLDSDGNFSLSAIDARAEASRCMAALGEDYDILDGWYPEPKPVTFSKIMSYQFITGIFSPFTIEGNYNNDIPDSEKPYVMCHELSHLKGFMREDEAEFIAYLACMRSDTVEFKYSASLGVLTYVLNAAYDNCDREKYVELIESLDEQIITDLRYRSAYWTDYETKISVAANAVNNAYLQANNQDDGVHSYGRMIDLMLAYYSASISE